MIMHHRAGSLLWLAMGIYTTLSAYRLGLGSFRQPGPGFIFFLMALLLTLLSAIDLGTTFFGRSNGGKEEYDEPLWIGLRWRKILLVITGMSVYIYVFDFLGFLLSTFLLLVFLFKAVEPTRWWVSILSSLITMLLSYGVFGLWLKVPFPQGILGL